MTDAAPSNGEQLLSVAEVAEHVGLKHQAVRRAISRGELAAIKLCGRVRVEPAALEAWIEAGRFSPTPVVHGTPRAVLSASNGLRRLLDKGQQRA
jgi:excisionase family DNA binding protein